MSYNGGIDYGLLGDYDALPDIDVIAEGIDRALGELLSAARGERVRPRRRRPAGSRAAPRAKGRNRRPASEQRARRRLSRPRRPRANRGPAADMRAKRAARQPARSAIARDC